MPPRARRKPLPASLSPARRELAEAVRTLLDDAGGSLRSVANQIHSSRSALGRLAAGQVGYPDKKTVLNLLRLAARKNPAVTMTEEELERLVQQVWDEDPHVARPAGALADGGTTTAGPGTPHVAPVLVGGGDRRNCLTAYVRWPIEELAKHVDNARYEHAMGMLDYAGGRAPAKEAADAIQACRDWGLAEAVDTLLRMVGRRPGTQVLAVVGHLMDVGNIADARALLRITGDLQEV
jgi:hypothetical protein